MSESVKNRCRICLDVDSDHVSILEDSLIQLHMKSCLSLTISGHDNLPKTICMSCVSQLGDFYHFQLNARCSQDWLESCIVENTKKSSETKAPIQPLPDSEYNSDSLLEFLNNTANIEEYLSNLGKDDIPSIVNMLDKNNENPMDTINRLTCNIKSNKVISPKKKELPINPKKCKINMEIDVLDSDIEIVQELLLKETEPKPKTNSKSVEKQTHNCFGCKTKFDSLQKLSQHISICDTAVRTCSKCMTLFDSKQKMLQHRISHTTNFPTSCSCGTQLSNSESLLQHYRICSADYSGTPGCIYRCKQCSLIFKDRLLLYKHAKTHVMKNEERVCDICSHTFLGDEALSTHKMKDHNQPHDVMYRCKVCSYISKDRREIYLHVKHHVMPTTKQRHLCESCGESFSAHTSLMRHSVKHKNGNDSTTKGQTSNGNIKLSEDKTMCEHCGLCMFVFSLGSHSCVKSFDS